MNRFWWISPAVALGFGVAACSILAGRVGALVSLTFAAAIPLVVFLLALGTAHRRPASPERPATKDGWTTFHDISRELAWAKVSRRHFDSAPRRMLQRVAAAALDSRASVDFYADRDRERAIELIGPDLWPLIDPKRPASTDSDSPGLAAPTIDRLLTRLERL